MAIKYNGKGVAKINGNGGTDNINTYKHGSTVVGKRPMERHFVCNTSAAKIRIHRVSSSDPIISGAGGGDIYEGYSTYDSVPTDHLSDTASNGARNIFYGDSYTFYCSIATTGYYFMSTSTISNGDAIDTTNFSSLTYYINCNNTYPCYITESHGLSTKIGTSGAARQDSGAWFAYGTTLYGGVNVPTSTTSGSFYCPDSHGTVVSGDGYDIGTSGTVNPATRTEGTTGLSFSLTAAVHYHYKVSGSGLPAGTSYCSSSSSASGGSSSGSLVDIGTSSSGTAYIFFTATGQTVPTYGGTEGTLVSGTKGAPGAKYRLSVSIDNADVSRACSYNTYKKITVTSGDSSVKLSVAPDTSSTPTSIAANSSATVYYNSSYAYVTLVQWPVRYSKEFNTRKGAINASSNMDGKHGYDASATGGSSGSYGVSARFQIPTVNNGYITISHTAVNSHTVNWELGSYIDEHSGGYTSTTSVLHLNMSNDNSYSSGSKYYASYYWSGTPSTTNVSLSGKTSTFKNLGITKSVTTGSTTTVYVSLRYLDDFNYFMVENNYAYEHAITFRSNTYQPSYFSHSSSYTYANASSGALGVQKNKRPSSSYKYHGGYRTDGVEQDSYGHYTQAELEANLSILSTVSYYACPTTTTTYTEYSGSAPGWATYYIQGACFVAGTDGSSQIAHVYWDTARADYAESSTS